MGTEDGWYHQDAFFRVRFRQASCDADCSVCELTNDLITVGDNYEESMITIIDPPTPPTPPITVIETPYTDGGSVGACPSCCSGLGQEDHSVEWITSQDDPMGNMTATATVILQEATTFDLLWSAVAEDQYETLTITVNGVVKTQFTAKSDGICAVSTCVMCVIKEQSQQIQLNAGTNIITVDTTTEDGWYHQDAFFRVRFRQASCDADCSVCELTNELITVGEGASASEPPATTVPPTIPVKQPPLITTGSKPTTVDDIRFPPIGPEECPYDILLLKHDGVTTYPKNSVRVLSRDAKTVTVDLSQLFTTSTLANPTTIDYIFYQYNVNVFNNKCFEEDNVVGGESLAVITIECTRTSQVASWKCGLPMMLLRVS